MCVILQNKNINNLSFLTFFFFDNDLFEVFFLFEVLLESLPLKDERKKERKGRGHSLGLLASSCLPPPANHLVLVLLCVCVFR